MKKLILTAAMLIFSTGVFAANSGQGTVGVLTFSDGGNLFFTTTATAINPAGCVASSYVIASTNAQFKNYYAMMLTAQASGSNVIIRISDTACITLGTATYPRVLLVQQIAS